MINKKIYRYKKCVNSLDDGATYERQKKTERHDGWSKKRKYLQKCLSELFWGGEKKYEIVRTNVVCWLEDDDENVGLTWSLFCVVYKKMLTTCL